MRKIIHNAHLVSPGIDRPGVSIVIEDGRIAALHEGEFPASDEAVLDAGGRLVLPGFIDLHSHGADGADVCDESPGSLTTIARRKLQEGVTTWLPTTLSQPRDRLRSIVAKIAEFRAGDPPLRCPGLHLEGPFLHREKAGAQNPQFLRPPDFTELEELHAICPITVVSLAPELPGALELIRGAREIGIASSAAHTTATAAEIRRAVAAGLTHLTHFGNAMTPLHHREIGTLGEGLLNDGLMLEIIADAIHLAPDMLRLIFKTVPLDRLMLITDSVAASWRPDGDLDLGGLAVTVKNGIATLSGSETLAGSTLRFNQGLKILAETTGRPLSELVAVTSWNQARSLGWEGLGRIEPGFHADLVLLDPDFSVHGALVGGVWR